MARPGAEFARVWRRRMAAALNGTWNDHSGFLAERLSQELPEHVHVEPVDSFFPVPCSRAGLAALLEGGPIDLERSYSVHLWARLWWSAGRTDFSKRHGGELTVSRLRDSDSPLARLVRPFLPAVDVDDVPG
jgi:hypothetical protein